MDRRDGERVKWMGELERGYSGWERWREGKVDGRAGERGVDGRAGERVKWMGELERGKWMGGLERG